MLENKTFHEDYNFMEHKISIEQIYFNLKKIHKIEIYQQKKNK